MITDTLPLKVEELTAEWFAEVLGEPVATAEMTDVIWGTATKAFFTLDGTRTLCVKGGFQEELRSYGIADCYLVEATFYEQVAPHLTDGVPRTWFAGVAPSVEQGIVIFDDLRAEGCTFGDPVAPMSVDLAAATLELLAGWHAASAQGLDTSALTVGSPNVRVTADALFTPEHFASFGRPEDPAQIHAAFRALWASDDAGVHWLSHGDTHIGNTFVRADGRPGFLDWQVACLAPPMYDVSYFVGGALTVDDRRANETALLQTYLDALVAAGGPALDRDAAWLDYRRHALHGFFWAVTPPVMQTAERVAAMGERHLAMIEDLETMAAVELPK